MKKLTAVILVMTLALGMVAAASADGGGWPVRDTTGTRVSFRSFGNDSEQRHQSYYGPGKQYAQAGAYKPYKVKTASALFQEGDYVLVDFDYQTAGKHCVYFKASNLANKPYLETVNLTGYPAKTQNMLIPMCGLGSDYEYVTQRKKSKYATYDVTTLCALFGDTWIIYQTIVESYKDDKFCVYLEKGTRVNVFFESRGWVFAEFTCEAGLVRAWLPVSSVEGI